MVMPDTPAAAPRLADLKFDDLWKRVSGEWGSAIRVTQCFQSLACPWCQTCTSNAWRPDDNSPICTRESACSARRFTLHLSSGLCRRRFLCWITEASSAHCLLATTKLSIFLERNRRIVGPTSPSTPSHVVDYCPGSPPPSPISSRSGKGLEENEALT